MAKTGRQRFIGTFLCGRLAVGRALFDSLLWHQLLKSSVFFRVTAPETGKKSRTGSTAVQGSGDNTEFFNRLF
jgi:hypothetical protein